MGQMSLETARHVRACAILATKECISTILIYQLFFEYVTIPFRSNFDRWIHQIRTHSLFHDTAAKIIDMSYLQHKWVFRDRFHRKQPVLLRSIPTLSTGPIATPTK